MQRLNYSWLLIMLIIHRLFALRSMFGTVKRWGMYLLAGGLGLALVGPIVESGEYQATLNIIALNPVLSYLVDVEGWITDQLISCAAVLFSIWACVFSLYSRSKKKVDSLNVFFGYFSCFTRGLGTVLITLFMFFLGIGVYPMLMLHELSIGIGIIALSLCLFGFPGLFISHCSTIFIRPNHLLDVIAPYAAAFFGLLAVVAWAYSAVSFIGIVLFLSKWQLSHWL